MSNYIEYNNKIAFHPGYYIKEYIDEVGLTQEDFANRLGTTAKNISYIVRGEQSLSVDIALKLSKLMGTSIQYWLNIQSQYDAFIAEFDSYKEQIEEKELLKTIGYKYFRDFFNLPDLPKKLDEQILALRQFLQVSSLTVFKKRDMYVRYRSADLEKFDENIIKANIMVHIATNIALKLVNTPKFDKKKLLAATEYILTLTDKHDTFYPIIEKVLYDCGVNLIVLPNLAGSKINGATKKIGDHIMMMINDRNAYSDSFWFTLFHEIGHIINGDFGISFMDQTGEIEEAADAFAKNALIPQEQYEDFVKNIISVDSIRDFAKKIHRDPGIIVGRLQNDGYLDYSDREFLSLKTKYSILVS